MGFNQYNWFPDFSLLAYLLHLFQRTYKAIPSQLTDIFPLSPAQAFIPDEQVLNTSRGRGLESILTTCPNRLHQLLSMWKCTEVYFVGRWSNFEGPPSVHQVQAGRLLNGQLCFLADTDPCCVLISHSWTRSWDVSKSLSCNLKSHIPIPAANCPNACWRSTKANLTTSSAIRP